MNNSFDKELHLSSSRPKTVEAIEQRHMASRVVCKSVQCIILTKFPIYFQKWNYSYPWPAVYVCDTVDLDKAVNRGALPIGNETL